MYRREMIMPTILAGLIFLGVAPAPSWTSAREDSLVHFSLAKDLRQMAAPRGLGIVALGSAATAVAWAMEDSDTQARSLGGLGTVGDLGNAAGSPYVVLAGAATLTIAGRLTDSPRVTAVGIDMARAVVYSGIAVAALKVGVDRARPDGDRYSFPSGHAAAAFSAAPVLARHFGRAAGTAAYAVAGAVAIGRMRDRRHYLSDVLFGATLGFVAGDAVAGQRASPVASLVVEPGLLGIRARF